MARKNLEDEMIPEGDFGEEVRALGGSYTKFRVYHDLTRPETQHYKYCIVVNRHGQHFRRRIKHENLRPMAREPQSYAEAVMEQCPKAKEGMHALCKILAMCDVNGQGETSDIIRIFGEALLAAHKMQLSLGLAANWKRIVWDKNKEQMKRPEPSDESKAEATNGIARHKEENRRQRDHEVRSGTEDSARSGVTVIA